MVGEVNGIWRKERDVRVELCEEGGLGLCGVAVRLVYRRFRRRVVGGRSRKKLGG